jgi:hypothetical protein
MTRTETARKPIGYIMKYVSKGTSDANFKKGLRMVGTGGLSAAQRLERAWWKLPRWLREESEPKDRIVKAKGAVGYPGLRVGCGRVFGGLWGWGLRLAMTVIGMQCWRALIVSLGFNRLERPLMFTVECKRVW